ncbi:MAG: carbohydrate binding domain-containing protein, partial [Acidobacteriota bacterium]
KASKAGRFYFEKTGRRAKFWGVNFKFRTNFPDKTTARKVAAHLAKLGVNVVRFHHMDFYARPNGIFDPNHFPNDTRHLDAIQLDRWDYLVSELRKNGIYVNINLKVARHFGPGDGLPETNKFTSNSFFRGISHINPRMIELQKEYAQQLLDRENTYTGLKYTEDPGVLCLEIANEDSLFGSLLTDGEINYIEGQADSLPQVYSTEIDQRWNQWLRDRYGSNNQLENAWKPEGPAIDSSDKMRNGGFESGMSDWWVNQVDAARATTSIVAGAGPDGSAALKVDVDSDGTNWHVQLTQDGHSIEAGKRYEIRFYAKATKAGGITIDVMKGAPDWRNYGLSKRVLLSTTWKQYRGQFLANETDPLTARPTFELGEVDNTIWIDKVEFSEVSPIGLGPGESLTAQTIQRPLRSSLGRYSNQRNLDLLTFYGEMDSAYFSGMRTYLKTELGARALVTGTAPWWCFLGDMKVQAELDFVDGHMYWDHPWWPSVPAWSPTGWIIHNRPLVNEFHELSSLAAIAVEGKPYTVSEFNQPFPNQYALEGPLLIALVANQQDWDAVYMFDYGWPSDSATTSFFSLAGNPVKSAQMPIASRIFLGQQSQPSRVLEGPAVNMEEVYQGYVEGRHYSRTFLEGKGWDPRTFFQSRFRIRGFNSPQPVSIEQEPPGTVIRSDHGELTWDRTDANATTVKVEGPGVQGVIGFTGIQRHELDGWDFRIRNGGPAHAAVVLQSWDGTPIRETRRLLLSVWTEHENTGMVWNAEHTSVDNRWGRAPTIIRPSQVEVRFAFPAAQSIQVYPLDATGKRGARLSSGSVGSREYLLDTKRDETVWYEVELNGAAPEAPYGSAGDVLSQLYTQAGGSSLQFGWVELEESGTPLPESVAVLEYSSQGDLTSATRLPATLPRNTWAFPILHEGRTTTAIALVNPSATQTANAQIVLRDSQGKQLQQTIVEEVGARKSNAFYLFERFTASGPLTGSVEVTSDQALGCLVLRSTTNRNGEIFLTPVPFSPPEDGAAEQYFAQLAGSSSYSTDLSFLNPSGHSITALLTYFDASGQRIREETLQLGPWQMTRTVLRGEDGDYYGYASLTGVEGPTLPQATAVMTQWTRGTEVSEVAIPALPAFRELLVLASERPSQSSALALLNPGSGAATITAELLSTAEHPDLGRQVEINLGSGERKAIFLRELFTETPTYFNSLLRLTSDEDFGVLPLLGIYNKKGTFLLSSLAPQPPVDGAQTNRIIGRFLTGSGFRTLFYFFDTTSGGGQVRFVSSDGQPLGVAVR